MNKGINLAVKWKVLVQEGDEQAYLDIYAHYYHYLNFIGLKKGYATDKVKDHINDVFLYIWENRLKLKHIHHHHNYIVTAFLRKLFSKAQLNVNDNVLMEDLTEFVIAPSVEEVYMQKQEQNKSSLLILSYVEQLPEQQRKLIYQKFYMGLSYNEIAQSNNISINTVYNTIYKATAKLKEQLVKGDSDAINAVFLLLYFLFAFFSF